MQNNLQELCALLTFILPDLFANNEESLRKLFKVPRTDGATVEKLKKMLAPFMLRRLKKEVLIIPHFGVLIISAGFERIAKQERNLDQM